MNGPSHSPAETAANFAGLVGSRFWAARMAELERGCGAGQRTSRAIVQRYGIEIALERLRRVGRNSEPSPQERVAAALAEEVCAASQWLQAAGRKRLRAGLLMALQGGASLVPLFHLARTARLQRGRGFEVDYAGFAEAAPFDLLVARDGAEAEIVCDVVSAEAGRDLHRGAWVRLVDRVDPDLQTWLAAHPGRYLLKMTLPKGLRAGPEGDDRLATLHGRIRDMLVGQRRADHDEAAVLRLDPLMLAGSQADELGLMRWLRREFGHEAHLAVTVAAQGVFVMAARAGREDSVAVAVRERLAALAPVRLSGTRPGILAMLVDDTDRAEWTHLCDRLILEGEARQFLTRPEARGVVAVTCTSRLDLLAEAASQDGDEGELRFRNAAHPLAKAPGLAPAVLSTN